MPVRLTWLMMAVWLTCPSGAVVAQPPDADSAKSRPKKPTSFVSLVTQQTGDPALIVRYPWKVHQRPSVEIRLVRGAGADLSEVRPLYFVKEFFKGVMTVNVYHCQDRAAGVPLSRPLKEKGIEFEILGRRNALGRPAVSVARRVPSDDPAPGSGLVFCLLPAWAVDERLLHLELPPKYFAPPGKLYVWFLRDDEVLWEQMLDWPGLKEK